ncbi:MAG: hypothetical protein IPN18_14655 [Ignavibacteriales bacterium]|nr:hypothetical protein [Ignavibacteriales bacterium]
MASNGYARTCLFLKVPQLSLKKPLLDWDILMMLMKFILMEVKIGTSGNFLLTIKQLTTHIEFIIFLLL